MKKIADLTEADTERAYDLGKELLLWFSQKNAEPMIAIRALEMVSSTLLHGGMEIEGRSIVEDFVRNIRELHASGQSK